MPLSDTQQAALDLSCHVAISAAAGSGKTTILVERFVKILEANGFKPEQIVAITFTEEAAAQIKQGILSAVQKKSAECTAKDDPWDQVYPLLPLAKITTIHGFCLSLIREYPLEVGLNPSFSMLSAGEQKLHLLQCIRESLRELSRCFNSHLAVLLDYIPRQFLEPLFLEMIERRSYIGDFLTPAVEALQRVYRYETAEVVGRLDVWEKMQNLLNRLPEQLMRETNSCSRRCLVQRELLAHRTNLSNQEFIKRLEETFSVRVNPTRNWSVSPIYEELREIWASVRKELKRYALTFQCSERENRHFHKALSALSSLYQEILKRYQQRKVSESALDFEDLLELAVRLLQNDRVRRALVRRFRFLLVDEFQDTNFRQWEILKRLIGLETNFFAVGDPKQSIYRFRDADVTVFRRVQQWIKREGRLVEMNENYRSLPQLVAFQNEVFRGLFNPGLDYEAVHQDVEAIRGSETAPKAACVQAHFYEGSEVSEPEVTARWVNYLVESESFKYSDLAILLRRRTHLKKYEETLRGAGVPFQTVAGIGFYERQEVLDLVNLLRFLHNTADDIALLGVLRSPLFNFSDEDLFLLSLAPGTRFWNKLANSHDELWSFARERLHDWLAVFQRHTIAGFLRRAIQETGYLEILTASSRGPQNLRNVRKFLDLIREFEKGRSRSVSEFLRFFNALVQSEPQEAEATVLEGAGEAVRIYTIHGAKGLQFPVVILPELGSPLLPRRNLFFTETIRSGSTAQTFLGLRIWNPEEQYQEFPHPVYRMLQRLDEYRQIAEEKRLLYVAVTRARDRLILVGKKTDEPSYAKWICENAKIQSTAVPGLMGDRHQFPIRQIGVRSPLSNSDSLVADYVPEKRTWSPGEIALFSCCPRKFYLSQIGAVPEQHPLRLAQLEQTNSHVGRVKLHPFYQRLSNAVRLYSEKPFHIQHGERVIKGVIDKLFQEQDGRWVVVDFKTDELRSLEIQEKIAEHGYDLQLEIDMWAVSKILSCEHVEGYLFFTFTGELIRLRFTPVVAERCETVISRLPLHLRASAFPRTAQPAHCAACGFYSQRFCPGAQLSVPRPQQTTLW